LKATIWGKSGRYSEQETKESRKVIMPSTGKEYIFGFADFDSKKMPNIREGMRSN